MLVSRAKFIAIKVAIFKICFKHTLNSNMMFLLPSWLCSSDEFTEHVNTAPLSELFTDWSIRTDNSSWAV